MESADFLHGSCPESHTKLESEPGLPGPKVKEGINLRVLIVCLTLCYFPVADTEVAFTGSTCPLAARRAPAGLELSSCPSSGGPLAND